MHSWQTPLLSEHSTQWNDRLGTSQYPRATLQEWSQFTRGESRWKPAHYYDIRGQKVDQTVGTQVIPFHSFPDLLIFLIHAPYIHGSSCAQRLVFAHSFKPPVQTYSSASHHLLNSPGSLDVERKSRVAVSASSFWSSTDAATPHEQYRGGFTALNIYFTAPSGQLVNTRSSPPVIAVVAAAILQSSGDFSVFSPPSQKVCDSVFLFR